MNSNIIEYTTYPQGEVSIFYKCFSCFKKIEIIDEKYYHLIFSYVYTTDGKLFIGRYNKEINDVDTMAIDPEINFCYCFIRNDTNH
jgi:hypothetical protein